MLISTKGRYALKVLIDLAEKCEPEKYRRLDAIAQSQCVSEKYLESIVKNLVKAGMIEGQRGRGGGYRLTKAPEEYSLGEIIRTADGSLAPVSCLEEDAGVCERAESCRTLPVWKELDARINGYLDSVSLRDLLR